MMSLSWNPMGCSSRISVSSPNNTHYRYRSLPVQPNTRLSLSSPHRCFSLSTKYHYSGGGGGRRGSGGYGGGGGSKDDGTWSWFCFKKVFWWTPKDMPEPSWFRTYIVSCMVAGWLIEMKTNISGRWIRSLLDEKRKAGREKLGEVENVDTINPVEEKQQKVTASYTGEA